MTNEAKIKKTVATVLIVALLVIICIVDLVPLYYMIAASFKTRFEYLNNIIGLPVDFTFENYVNIIVKFNFPRMFFNSILITSVSVLAGIYIASLAAFAFGKMKFKGRDFMFNLMVPLMSIPAIVMFLPLFVMMKNIDLIDRYPAPILIYIGLILPFSIFLLTSFMDSVPNVILDTARIDGCKNYTIFHKMILPLLSPAISTAVIVNGMWIWNELLIAFIFLQSESKKTLVVKLTTLQGLHDMNVPLVMAGATIVSVPIIIAFVISQRWFIRGLVQGSIK
jgi:ABC-type glycerol-3-phosphate transport system permease component